MLVLAVLGSSHGTGVYPRSPSTLWLWCRGGWVGAAGERVHCHAPDCLKMANAWKLAVSQGFCWAVGELWLWMRLFPAVGSQV